MFEFINNSEERGQVGIGTLIVFIAMVLVAAIAAGVLINTAGFLQSQAEATGEESTDLVSERIDVTSSVGIVAGDTETLNEIRISVSGAPGADQIDLSEATIQAVGPGGQENLVFTPVAIDFDVNVPGGTDEIEIQDAISVDSQTVEVGVSTLDTGEQLRVTNEDGDGEVIVEASAEEINTVDISGFSISDADTIQAELLDENGDSLGTPETDSVDASDSLDNSVDNLGANEFAVESGGEFESNPVLDGESYTILLNPAAGAFQNTDFTNDRFGQGDTATLDIVSPSSATTQVELNAPDLFTEDGEAVRL